MSEKQTSGSIRLSLTTVSIIIAVVTLLMAGLLVYTVYRTDSSYASLTAATEEYIACQADTYEMQAASDYLTSSARAFAVTGDASKAHDFFTEVNVTRRRDNAVENMKESLAGSLSYEYLVSALDASNNLIIRETTAMRLAAEGYGIPLNELPVEIQEAVLSPEEAALSPEEKREKAVELLLGDEYQQQKNVINENLSKCSEELIARTKEQQEQASERLHQLLNQERELIILFVVIVVLMLVFLLVYVIHPLRAIIHEMNENQEVQARGTKEIQYLANTYNVLSEQQRESNQQLSYEASHDPLTGAYNRGMFEKVRETETNFGLILMDVDKFKTINDTYGHDMGDKVLKKVGEELLHHFRSNDYVCRIGGDEFAVIMVKAGSNLTELVDKKVRSIQDTLRHPEGDLPVTTVSVGVAFSDRPHPVDTIFKDADKVLYEVKEQGGNDVRFF